jgi:hypothetical protein
MKMKKTSLMIATVFAANSMAFAEPGIFADSDSISKAALEEMLNISDAQSRAELEKTLNQIALIRGQLNNLLVKKSDNWKLDVANKIQAALALISAGAGALHLSAKDSANLSLALTTGSAIVSVAIKHINKGKNITTEQMSEIVSEATQDVLAKTKDMSDGMRNALLSINTISLELQESKQWSERLVDKTSGSQELIALGN